MNPNAVTFDVPQTTPPSALPQHAQNGNNKPVPVGAYDKDEAIDGIRRMTTAVLDEVAKVIVGKREVLEFVTMNILAGGNVLFEDFPGLAKSLLSETFSKASGCDFNRIQFTPDLLPSDILGANVFNQKNVEFEFRAGPVFTNFLLADEINRAPPKTQSALLETMQERQVTVEGVTRKLKPPYIVMATQNPTEQEGTFPLPEAQLDRFLFKLSMGYPSEDEEHEIIERRIRRASDSPSVRPVTTPEEIVWAQKSLELVQVHPLISRYMVKVVQATRHHNQVYVGSGPRGTLALLKASRAWAAMQGRAFVIPDDVKHIAANALAHRIILKPEPRIRGVQGADIIREVLESVRTPVQRAIQ